MSQHLMPSDSQNGDNFNDSPSSLGSEAARAESNERGNQALDSSKASLPIEFRLAQHEPSPGLGEFTLPGSDQKMFVGKESIATNMDVVSAQVVKAPEGGLAIEVTFTDASAKRLREATESHLNNPLAIFAAGKLLAAPRIQTPISRKMHITGDFRQEEAERIANAFNTIPKPVRN